MVKVERCVGLIAVLLSCCTGCGSFSFETDNVAQDVEWAFRIEEGHAVITNLTIVNPATVTCLCIPSQVGKGIPVKKVEVPSTAWSSLPIHRVYVDDGIEELSAGLLANNYFVESVSLPESLKFIPDYFAYMARKLRSMEFRGKSRIDRMGQYAFYNSGLNHIDLPSEVSAIGNGAFAFCPLLATINLNKGLSSIGTSAFEGDSKLLSVIIPSGVVTLGDWSFYYPNAHITIPSSVASVGRHAFGAGVTLSFWGNPPKWLTAAWVDNEKIHAICCPRQDEVWEKKVNAFKGMCLINEL